MSLTGLARSIHYSKGYLSKIENGSKPPTLDVARRCDEVLGADGELIRLVRLVPKQPGAAPARTGPGASFESALCPYRGLAAYGPHDAEWFYGRESATAELTGRLAERVGRGPLAVVAPSGAGKSSLLQAGLLPALRRGALPVPGSADWPVVVCTPTAHPLKELLRCAAQALGAAGAEITPDELAARPGALLDACAAPGRTGGLVVLVDQFEETFTLCEDERERRDFVAVLHTLATTRDTSGATARSAVVIGMRADFCGRCLDHPHLVEVFTHGLYALGPMSGTQLRQAITGPAERAGLSLEAGLVELLLRDLGTDSATSMRLAAPPRARPARHLAAAHQPHPDRRGLRDDGRHPRRGRPHRRVRPRQSRPGGATGGPPAPRPPRTRRRRHGANPQTSRTNAAATAVDRPRVGRQGPGRLRVRPPGHRGQRSGGDHP